MNATNSERKTKEGKGDSNQTKLKLGIQTKEESRGLNAQNKTRVGPLPGSPISQEKEKRKKKRQNKTKSHTFFVVV